MRITLAAGAERIGRAAGHRAVDVRNRCVVEVAADDVAGRCRSDDRCDQVDLFGTQDTVFPMAMDDAPHLRPTGRIGQIEPLGDELVVAGLDVGRAQVVVEHAHDLVADLDVGPERPTERGDRIRADDRIFAQNQHRPCNDRPVAADFRIGFQQVGKCGTFTGQRLVILLQADDIRCELLNHACHTVGAALAAVVIEVTDVVGQ